MKSTRIHESQKKNKKKTHKCPSYITLFIILSSPHFQHDNHHFNDQLTLFSSMLSNCPLLNNAEKSKSQLVCKLWSDLHGFRAYEVKCIHAVVLYVKKVITTTALNVHNVLTWPHIHTNTHVYKGIYKASTTRGLTQTRLYVTKKKTNTHTRKYKQGTHAHEAMHANSPFWTRTTPT